MRAVRKVEPDSCYEVRYLNEKKIQTVAYVQNYAQAMQLKVKLQKKGFTVSSIVVQTDSWI